MRESGILEKGRLVGPIGIFKLTSQKKPGGGGVLNLLTPRSLDPPLDVQAQTWNVEPGPMRGGAGGASAPGPGCLGGPGGKQKHRCWPSWIFFFLIGSQCMGDPGF